MTIPLHLGCELRHVCLDDAEVMLSAIDRNRARLRRWFPWLDQARCLEDARSFLTQCVAENDQRAALNLGIFVAGRFGGAISLHRIDAMHRSTSIGYWISEEFAGRGLMTECCRSIVTTGFREYGLHRIEIRCATGNERSAAIPKRLGFSEEGLLREAEWLYDHWVDLRVFSMLEQDWTPQVSRSGEAR